MSLLKFLKMPDAMVKSAVDAYVGQITKVSHPLAIYLFGSLGRGEASVESDIDLLVVYADQTTAKNMQRIVMRQPSPFPMAADLLFIDLETWQGKKRYSALVSVVKDEGKLVFASENWLLESGKEHDPTSLPLTKLATLAPP